MHPTPWEKGAKTLIPNPSPKGGREPEFPLPWERLRVRAVPAKPFFLFQIHKLILAQA
jgi:hypothetical protein